KGEYRLTFQNDYSECFFFAIEFITNLNFNEVSGHVLLSPMSPIICHCGHSCDACASIQVRVSLMMESICICSGYIASKLRRKLLCHFGGIFATSIHFHTYQEYCLI
ncbi:MAG: hypothetical protein J0653_05150, partial [Deltaproteobacteria bacterium]|nr:hypothetical protein [Deltaproteobacteria bacterium]